MVSVPKQLLIQAILIAFNAFFASMEIAVISLNTTKLRKLSEDGDKNATKLLKFAENPAGFLSTIQVGISLSGFLGAAFAADSLSEPLANWFIKIGVNISYSVLNSISVIIITLILTFVTIVFGELIPKRIAQQKSYEVAKACCGIISTISIIFKPIIVLISGTTNFILKLLNLKTEAEDDNVSEDDIRLMVDVGGESGSIEEDEQEMIQNIFEFNDITISEIMTRVSDVNAISIEDSEEDILNGGNSYYEAVKEYAKKENSEVVLICAKIESELAELNDTDKTLFLKDLGIEESGLDQLIKKTYSLLGLATFFTAGSDEVKAWTFKKGMKAPQCAGIIHSDFERGFIKAEVMSYDDLISAGSEAKVKENGKLRIEGKEYVMQDGDICHFRFNL